MAFAPTRSGKGVGLVVPTLLGWSGSAVIHDIKGENWQLTAGWRQRFSHCLLFNPTDARSARAGLCSSRPSVARHLPTPTAALHIAYTDPRTNVVTEMVVDISNDDAPAGKSACGPGKAVFERMSVNGEIFGYKAAAALFQQLVWKANELNPVSAPAPRAEQPVEPAEPAPSNEMSLNEEAEADRQYYAEQSEKALKRPIMITDDNANLLCCITLRSIMNKLDAGGATVLISPSDDDSVQLQVEDPNGQWRGWRDYTLDFVPASNGGPLLLSKVVNAGQIVAEMDGSGARSTDKLLREKFPVELTTAPAR